MSHQDMHEQSATEQVVSEKQEPASPSRLSFLFEKAPNKPVLGYLVLLFLAAFLLILFSYILHDHSNKQTLREMQVSVETLQNMSNLQQELINLQTKTQVLTEQNTTLQGKLTDAQVAQEVQTKTVAALSYLSAMQTAQIDGNAERIILLIQEMQTKELAQYLPTTTCAEKIPSPMEQYTAMVKTFLPTNP